MPRSQQSRRSFLTGSSAVLAAATASAAFPWSAKAFANTMAVDRPRVGCIGLGGVGISVGDGGIGGSGRLPAAPVNDAVLCFCFL